MLDNIDVPELHGLEARSSCVCPLRTCSTGSTGLVATTLVERLELSIQSTCIVCTHLFDHPQHARGGCWDTPEMVNSVANGSEDVCSG